MCECDFETKTLRAPLKPTRYGCGSAGRARPTGGERQCVAARTAQAALAGGHGGSALPRGVREVSAAPGGPDLDPGVPHLVHPVFGSLSARPAGQEVRPPGSGQRGERDGLGSGFILGSDRERERRHREQLRYGVYVLGVAL